MRPTRELIEFRRKVLVPDGIGGHAYSTQTVWNPPFAYVREVDMADTETATKKGLRTFIEIECRYNPEKPIFAGDIVVWRGNTLTSLKPIPDRYGRRMKITAYSDIETSSREQ
jgi:hypothetical protein